MNVVDKRKNHVVEFIVLKNGDIFINREGRICIKFAELRDEDGLVFNTYVPKDGVLIRTSSFEDVTPVEVATLTIEDK